MKSYYDDEIGRTGNIMAWTFSITYALLFLKTCFFGGDFERTASFGILIIAILLYELIRYDKVAKRIAESSDKRIRDLEREIDRIKFGHE